MILCRSHLNYLLNIVGMIELELLLVIISLTVSNKIRNGHGTPQVLDLLDNVEIFIDLLWFPQTPVALEAQHQDIRSHFANP